MTCRCDLVSGHPMEGMSTPRFIKSYDGRYYGLPTPKAKAECIDECRSAFETKVDEYYLKEELRATGESLTYNREVGVNCTGPTTMKFPVQMKAYLGESSIGISHSSIHVVHFEKICF
jgi:hypothetical protein